MMYNTWIGASERRKNRRALREEMQAISRQSEPARPIMG